MCQGRRVFGQKVRWSREALVQKGNILVRGGYVERVYWSKGALVRRIRWSEESCVFSTPLHQINKNILKMKKKKKKQVDLDDTRENDIHHCIKTDL